jgi:hypothetical protein
MKEVDAVRDCATTPTGGGGGWWWCSGTHECVLSCRVFSGGGGLETDLDADETGGLGVGR